MADTDTPLKSVNPSCTGLSPGAARHQRPLAVSSRRIFKSGSDWSSVSRILIVFERHAAWPDKPFEGEKTYAPSCSSEPCWQEGAGGLLLVAAASETRLLSRLETAILPQSTAAPSPGLSLALGSRRKLWLTLLLLNAVGLRRTRDLRGYTGDALGLLTGRPRAYGYWHTERFLTKAG
jgi:hypothetical protein